MKISTEDISVLAQIVWYPSASRRGSQLVYAISKSKSRRALAHRLVVEQMLGRSLTKGEYVDHINHDPLDNRRTNLRICTLSQNSANSRLSRRNTSGYKGVSYCRTTKRWRASIRVERKLFDIGRFSHRDEAAWMRDQWALELHGDFAVLNFTYV
ncbi:HNH endonuclease [Rhodococcus qingshengii]|uniref:HNH endonuclease n=1 Tax=Rhodococcus qingshengii TaxID=334542 RepID=UPI00374D12F7